MVSPNAMRLLRRLGDLDRFLGAAVPIETGWEFRRWQDGSVLSSEEMSRCEELYGESSYFIHRADLLETVRGAVPVGLVHLGARCTGIDLRPDGAILHFANGSHSVADVVIGADGVHSTIRGAVVTPFYAQGAAQAIEDAAALALCLAVHRNDPELALDVYQRVRIPRAGRIQQLSHSRKDINRLPDGPEQQRRDAELCKGDALVRSGWIYAYDAEDAARQALSKELTDDLVEDGRYIALVVAEAVRPTFVLGRQPKRTP